MIDRVLSGTMHLALESSRSSFSSGGRSGMEISPRVNRGSVSWEIELAMPGMSGAHELYTRILEGRGDPFRRVVVADDLFDPVLLQHGSVTMRDLGGIGTAGVLLSPRRQRSRHLFVSDAEGNCHVVHRKGSTKPWYFKGAWW